MKAIKSSQWGFELATASSLVILGSAIGVIRRDTAGAFTCVAFLFIAAFAFIFIAAHTRTTNNGRHSVVLRILSAFAWFCSKQNREHIEFILADLKKDARQMRRDQRGQPFIYCVLLWHVAGTILPIMWDGSLRLLAALLPLGKLIAKIKGFF